MTLDVKARLRELLAKATPGPWHVDDDQVYIWGRDGSAIAGRGEGPEDAALIVAAINALPALLDRLESKASALREVDRLVSEHCGADARAVLGPVLRAALDDEAPR